MSQWTRRNFLAGSVAGGPLGRNDKSHRLLGAGSRRRSGLALKIGIVTYNIAKDWDL